MLNDRNKGSFQCHKHLTWFLLCIAIFSCAILRTQGFEWAHYALLLFIFAQYLLFSTGLQQQKNKTVFTLIVALIVYSIAASTYVSRSVFNALPILAAFLFYCTIAENAYDQEADIAAQTAKKRLLYLALAIPITVHALYAVFQYILTFERTTGAFKDYSQASFAILLCFGIIFSELHKNRVYSGLVLILFIAFFSAFSRTSNFLLSIFVLLLLILAFTGNKRQFIVKTITIGLIALACIYTLPNLKNTQSVDRGGLSDIKTLNSRVIYWSSAWNAIKKKPILGHGIESYQFTGIKVVLPNHLIYKPHNDYLQVWHDLGLIWLLIFCFIIGLLITKNIPWAAIKQTSQKLPLDNHEIMRLKSWVMLCLVAMYMSINFIIATPFFQLMLAIILAELLDHNENKNSN